MSVDLRHGVLDPPLPVAEGERWPSVASLWERAKFLFQRVIAFVGSSERLARREHIRRSDRRDLLDWLEPVEKIVRSCLIARAAIWLNKTAEGIEDDIDDTMRGSPIWRDRSGRGTRTRAAT